MSAQEPVSEEAQADPEEERLQQERNHILEYIKSKWVEPVVCPVCKTPDWQVGNIAVVPQFAGNNLIGGKMLYPLAQVMCANCGYVLLFNAVQAGLLEPDPLQEPPTAEVES